MRSGRGGGLRAGDLCDASEGLGVVERERGQDLTIDLDPGGFEPGDQLAVGEPVRARRGVDAHDPQRPEVALALLAVAVGVGEAALDGLARLAVRLAPSADEPLRLLHGLLVAAARLRGAVRAWHGSTPIGRGAGAWSPSRSPCRPARPCRTRASACGYCWS